MMCRDILGWYTLEKYQAQLILFRCHSATAILAHCANRNRDASETKSPRIAIFKVSSEVLYCQLLHQVIIHHLRFTFAWRSRSDILLQLQPPHLVSSAPSNDVNSRLHGFRNRERTGNF